MDVAVSLLIGILSSMSGVYSVPPDVCFQQFKWEDCGAPPKAVIYYYKSGSRCEVGFWRGCLPNPNMFADEYECVQTCIFSVRAKPHDFHSYQDNLVEEVVETTTEAEEGEEITTEAEAEDEAEAIEEDATEAVNENDADTTTEITETTTTTTTTEDPNNPPP